MISEEDKKFLKDFAYGKLPLISLAPVEKISFPLWDWEAKRFKKGAEEKGIDHRIKPSRVIFDLNTNQSIVVTYSIDSDSCTFLKDGKCEIYEQRGFICRLFPFQHGPFLKMDNNTKANMFGSCPSISNIITLLDDNDKKTFVKQLLGSFGDSFLAVVQHDIITEWVNYNIIRIMKNKLIRPAMNQPYDQLMEKIENSKMIDFTDFLVKSAEMSDGDKENIIKQFENFEGARKKVNEILES